MSAEKIRLGFIGSGGMGQRAHIINFAQMPEECELVALAEVRPELASKVATHYGIGDIYPDHTSMLAEADIDAVVAIMGYSLHHAVVPDVLRAGKHLMTEKPIGCRASSAKEWKALADERDLIYLVGYMKRWDLGARYVTDLIRQWRESGEFGKLTYLSCNMSGTDWTWNPEPAIRTREKPEGLLAAEPFPDHMNDEEAQYYNMNINFYVHQVNLIRFLLGEDYDLSYTHPDGKVLIATSDSGTAITLEMSTYGLKQTWDEEYHICFEGADIRLSLPAPMRTQQNGEVEIRRNTGDDTHEIVRPNIPPSWCFFEEAKGFLETIRAGVMPYDSAGEAARDLELFERYVEMMGAAGGKMS
jgi:predicted dehydrogenase